MDRSKNIIKVSFVGIAVNVVLVIFKAIVGAVSGSVAIIMDAVNNLSDALSSIITIIGTKLAGKEPNKKHPYGYGRIEYISSVIIAILILVAGATSMKESIDKIVHPTLAKYSAVSLVIIIVAVIAKLFLGKFVKSQGKKLSSQSLIASGQDALFDSIISVSTLVAAVISMVFKFSIEGYLGAVISVVILKAGIDVLIESLSGIIGERIDGGLAKEIKAHIREFDGVIGAYDLILHKYGPDKIIGSVHIEIPDEMTSRELHSLSMHIIESVFEKYGIVLTVGIYASNITDEYYAKIREDINGVVANHDYFLQMHGFYVDEEKKQISFDLVIDFKCPNRIEAKDAVIADIKKLYPQYSYKANLDTDFSD